MDSLENNEWITLRILHYGSSAFCSPVLAWFEVQENTNLFVEINGSKEIWKCS